MLAPEAVTEETLSYRVNGSNAKPMAPTCAESSDRDSGRVSVWPTRVPRSDKCRAFSTFGKAYFTCSVQAILAHKDTQYKDTHRKMRCGR